MAFIIKSYRVGIVGFGEALFYAKNKNSARMKAFRSLTGAGHQVAFKDFLRLVPFIGEAPTGPEFGKPITVGDLPAYWVKHAGGNSVYFVRDDSDQVMISHENDVEEGHPK